MAGGLLAAVLASLVTPAVSVTQAASNKWPATCTRQATLSTGSPSYRVVNGNFAPPGVATCIAANPGDTQFSVDRTIATKDEASPAYIAIFTGCILGYCLMPEYPSLEASDIHSEITNWSFAFSASGKFDATYDSYFNTTPTPQKAPTGGELEIWLNHQNASLAGPQLPDVTIDNTQWQVYSVYKTSAFGNWWRIAFERVAPVTDVSDFDIAPFIQAAIMDGAIKPYWYQQDLEAGFEIWSGGVGLANYAFSAVAPTVEPSTPSVSLALPKCAATWSGKRCAAFRHTAGAWRYASGLASGNVDVTKVVVTAYRYKQRGIKAKRIIVNAKFTDSAGWKARLGKLTKGRWRLTAVATNAYGQTQTSNAIIARITRP